MNAPGEASPERVSCASGGKVLGLGATDLLTSPAVLEEAKKEFRERMQGRIYSSLIPADQEPPLPI
jgi:hypothetical protein